MCRHMLGLLADAVNKPELEVGCHGDYDNKHDGTW
jgi:hypothetical protein